jgi:magnesium-transporting ATPase (P-type)
MAKPVYQLEIDAVFTELETASGGLAADEAARRLERYGPNELAFRKTPAWVRFLRQFEDPMVLILLATGLFTGTLTAFGSEMLPDTIVIFGVVILNAVLGFVQEGKAEGALDALRSMLVQECMVVRGGVEQQIAARELVPGDVVLLEAGDRIPADVRFTRVSNLHADESALTGESVPVQKLSGPLTGDDLVPGDQRNMGFSGTYVTQGSAHAVVHATGEETAFGRIADLVRSAEARPSPLQRKIRVFVRGLTIAIPLIGLCNFLYGLYLGFPLSYSFLGAVSLVVATIPAMLPALITSILALAAIVMANKKALIRRLPAAETLGATSVICSDKTGTLTENRMTVTRVLAGGLVYRVTGDALGEHGSFDLEVPMDEAGEHALGRLLAAGYHCNNARVHGSNVSGDPTEIALRVAGLKGGILDGDVKRLVELPFDSSTKYQAVLVEEAGRRQVLVKGAPEVVLAMCTSELDAAGGQRPLHRAAALEQAHEFAGDALRTLAFACLPVDDAQDELGAQDLTDMVFLGLQGMIDPPREAAIQAVADCRRAGIRTVMITGDHPETARAVARQLGIDAHEALTGAELAHLDAAALRETVERVSVFARVAPEHKQAIAEALQANGHIVAMTGDGVNDAPALKTADIGVAMGRGGTEVAKEASDMVLEDDNFATIVAAVEEGRHAWNNLRKAILYTLPTNAAQGLLIMGAILLAAQVPLFATRFVLEPVQILWINLLDSVLLTMPLMMEQKERGLLDAPPRPAEAQIMDGLFIRRLVLVGLAIAAPGFGLYYYFGSAAMVDGELVDPLLLTQAQTAAFWGILLAHFGYVFSARSVDRSLFTFSPFSNPWLLGGVALSIAIRFVPTLIPEAASLFRTAEFPPSWWPLVLLAFLPSLLVIEVDKLLSGRVRRRPATPH